MPVTETVIFGDPQTLTGLLAVYKKAILVTLGQREMWFWINVVFQITSVVLGVLATLMMALQTETNKKWTKTIGIIATTLGAGIVTAYSTFHIRENIDKLIGIETQLISTANDLEFYIRVHPGTDVDLTAERKYADILNELGEQRRRIMGSIGNLNTRAGGGALTESGAK